MSVAPEQSIVTDAWSLKAAKTCARTASACGVVRSPVNDRECDEKADGTPKPPNRGNFMARLGDVA